MNRFSTREAAKKLGLHHATLAQYIAVKKVPAPETVITGNTTTHLWTLAEIEHVRQLLPKIANGRKTRYKKKHSAVSTEQSEKTKTPAGVPVPQKQKPQPRAPQPQHAKIVRVGGPVAVPHEQRKPKKKSRTPKPPKANG